MLYPVPVDGLYPVPEGSYAERYDGVSWTPGAPEEPVDEPCVTPKPEVSVGAREAPVPLWFVVFVVIFPVLLSTRGSSLLYKVELCGPSLTLSGFDTFCVVPGCTFPDIVVPGAYCARLFRSLSMRGSRRLAMSARCGPAVVGAGPV